MKRMHKIVTGVVATLALGIAAAAFAHSEGGPGFAPCAGDHPGMGQGHRSGPWGGKDPVAFAENRLAHLKVDLKISAQQEGAWQAFTVKAKKQAEEMQAVRSKLPQAAATAPERMAQRSEMMRAGLAGMESMTAAFKDLYAALSPEQKAIADRHFGAMNGPHMGRGMHHG